MNEKKNYVVHAWARYKIHRDTERACKPPSGPSAESEPNVGKLISGFGDTTPHPGGGFGLTGQLLSRRTSHRANNVRGIGLIQIQSDSKFLNLEGLGFPK